MNEKKSKKKEKAIQEMDATISDLSLSIGFDFTGEDFDKIQEAWVRVKEET